MGRLAAYFVLAALAMAPVHPAAAVIVGQIDTFEDGTAAGWHIGGGPVGVLPTPLPNIATGGPAGAGDNYLQISATGGAGAGSRLSAINATQWSGDYTAAGVASISMSLNNFGPDDLYLRLLFLDPMGGPPTNVALSTNAIFVPAGSGWIEAMFPILAEDLTALLGTTEAALSSATELRLFHNPSPFFLPQQNPAVSATLGVDNIRALGVPEPTTWAMMLLGFAAVGALMRRRRPQTAQGLVCGS